MMADRRIRYPLSIQAASWAGLSHGCGSLGMHFLCSTFGSAGDVFPMLGLALALRERGHDVAFATNGQFESVVRRHGLPFERLGTAEEYQECLRDPALWDPRKAFAYLFEYLRRGVPRQYELFAEHASKPDAVGVANCTSFGAALAQDKTGLPLVTVHVQPGVIWSAHRPPRMPGLFGPRWLKRVLYALAEHLVIDRTACPYLNDERRRLGLPPIRRLTRSWHSRFAVLCLFPEWYGPPQPDWPPNLIQTDFPLWNARSEEGLPREVSEFLDRGEPPIVFTPGSANIQARAFFNAAVEACRRLGRRGILLTEYPEQLPATLPDTVAHFRYVPLDLLLPRSAAFVHHGGVGSTSQGLAAGVPQVLMPLAYDQFDNADRVARLGVGSWVGVRQFTWQRLAKELDVLLSSPAVAERCRGIARRLEPRDGLPRAAAAIEERAKRHFTSATRSRARAPSSV